MSYDLRRTVINMLSQVDIETEQIMDEFLEFTTGCRVILLLERTKDGGHNEEDRRTFASRISYDAMEFKRNLTELMLLLATSEKPLRIYSCVNARDVRKVIRYVKQSLLDAEYADAICRSSIHHKLLKNPRHFLMQTNCRETSYFIIDVDDEEGKDCIGDALCEMARLELTELKRYWTKNGWHFVVEPFNSQLWNAAGSIKKDAMLLLKY